MKIVTVDYDIGNVRSILNACEKIGVTPILTRDKEEILNSDGVILPGVGAFSHGMKNLQKYSLVEIIKKYAKSGKPLLGICLGMQMLLDESEEFGVTKGIGLISGKVIKLPIKDKYCKKLPHVSWNEIIPKNINWDNTILKDINSKSDMYFVHSYITAPNDENNILSTTTYSNYEFCSSIKKGNI
ncbi:MAG: imidazole glycerol phosphate synthase subunit HisH, partial [Campylobacterota bacterium]|nr:imidazole glycerol phosphate synthase subunit HisH [Campylobacterota bacterium]